MLTHLSKTNAFCRRPFVISKKHLFVDSQPPLPLFNVATRSGRGHFHVATTLKRGEWVEMSNLEIEKLTGLIKQGVSQLPLSMIGVSKSQINISPNIMGDCKPRTQNNNLKLKTNMFDFMIKIVTRYKRLSYLRNSKTHSGFVSFSSKRYYF